MFNGECWFLVSIGKCRRVMVNVNVSFLAKHCFVFGLVFNGECWCLMIFKGV